MHATNVKYVEAQDARKYLSYAETAQLKFDPCRIKVAIERMTLPSILPIPLHFTLFK